jgi:hypothetical protein
MSPAPKTVMLLMVLGAPVSEGEDELRCLHEGGEEDESEMLLE